MKAKANIDDFLGKRVLIELSNGSHLKGILMDSDSFLNLSLTECDDNDNQHYRSCVIRGNAVLDI